MVLSRARIFLIFLHTLRSSSKNYLYTGGVVYLDQDLCGSSNTSSTFYVFRPPATRRSSAHGLPFARVKKTLTSTRIRCCTATPPRPSWYVFPRRISAWISHANSGFRRDFSLLLRPHSRPRLRLWQNSWTTPTVYHISA